MMRHRVSAAGDASGGDIWEQMKGAVMHEFFTGLLRLRRGPWEMLATALIALGVVMLMQPLLLWAYTWSFLVTLTGTVMFIVTSHFPD